MRKHILVTFLLILAIAVCPAFAASLVRKDTSGIYTAKKNEVELVYERTKNFKKFEQADGTFRVAGQIGNIHYKDKLSDSKETFKEIDLSINKTADKPWQYAMENNGYKARFWTKRELNGKLEMYVSRYVKEGKWLEMAPAELFWENEKGERQIISKPKPSGEPVIDNNAYTITWKNVFGPGIDYRYNVGTDKFFKTVIINSKNRLPAPKIDTKGLKLTVVLSMSWSKAVKPSKIVSKAINPKQFSYKDSAKNDLWWFQKPLGWDSSKNRKTNNLDWQIKGKDNLAVMDFSVSDTVLESETTTFPYYIDTAITEIQVGVSEDDFGGDTGTGVYPCQAQNTTSVSYMVGGWKGIFNRDGYGARGDRFASVPIPQGATINSASLAWNISLIEGTINNQIVGGALDSVGTFAEGYTVSAVYATDPTTAIVAWNPSSTGWQTSGNLSSIISEITSRAGWVSGNPLLLMTMYATTTTTTTQRVTAYTYDNNASDGAKFNCTYTIPPVRPSTHLQNSTWRNATIR